MGIALFKDHPNALFPFSEMDKDQRYYVEQIVYSCMRQYEISSRSTNHIVMQMGGGCILYTEPPPLQHHVGGGCNNGHQGQTPAVRLDARDVFDALCDCIFASKR